MDSHTEPFLGDAEALWESAWVSRSPAALWAPRGKVPELLQTIGWVSRAHILKNHHPKHQHFGNLFCEILSCH